MGRTQAALRSPVKIAAVIPARMASTRFPGKVLHPVDGLPMVEHVRRRTLLCRGLSTVLVATCDEEIAVAVRAAGGKVVMTSHAHRTGTDRVAEAVQQVDCSHVLIVQGDEPLVLPEHLERMVDDVQTHPDRQAWNAVGPLDTAEDLENRSVVKCVTSRTGRILFCSRDFSHVPGGPERTRFIYKLLGILVFQRDSLAWYARLQSGPYEQAESIEQVRILEHDGILQAVHFPVGYAGINHPVEVRPVEEIIRKDPRQNAIHQRIKGIHALDSASRRPGAS